MTAPLPPSITQYLVDPSTCVYNHGEEWDNRVTSVMQTWALARRMLEQANEASAEFMRTLWGNRR